MGRIDINDTLALFQKLVRGSMSWRTCWPFHCSSQWSLPDSLSRTSQEFAGMLVSKASSITPPMLGLSITKPSSVLRSGERGSKLNEPTDTLERSTAKVLACRLEPELPKGPRFSL